MRRFEYIQGNQAKFWEIARKGAVLTMASGKIGSAGKTRTKQFDDFMQAEQEFDRLIRDKLRRKYVEVAEPTEAVDVGRDRWIRLTDRATGDELDLKASATRYLTWRLVEVGVMDRQLPAPDLSRWSYRTSRRMRLAEVPTPGDEQYEAYRAMYLELSERDRAAQTGQSDRVGAYKFLQGTDWILTATEAGWLADAAEQRAPKRHKITANQTKWVDAFVAFARTAAAGSGFTVTLVEER